MVVTMVVLAAWLLGLAGFVVLKARQPRWEYPSPPPVEERPAWRDYADAA